MADIGRARMSPDPMAGTPPLLSRRSLSLGLATSFLPGQAIAAPDGFRVLEARPGTLRLVPDPAQETGVLGYDGQVPGPLLRFKKGEEVRIRLVNRLAQPTAIHWQGVRIANAMDGAAGLTQPAVPPGGSFDYAFTPPDSGTFLYRASMANLAGEQQGRGLHGVLIVEEAEPPKIDREIIALIEDWRLDAAGLIVPGFGAMADASHGGRIGGLVTLNGRAIPETVALAPGERVRLRIVNACIARVALVSFEGVLPLVAAIDGQPCDVFEPVRRTIPIGPGARFDVMFDTGTGAGQVIMRGDHEPDRVLVNLQPEGEARKPLPPIASLALNPLLPPVIKLQDSRKLDLVIEAKAKPDAAHVWTINGMAASGVLGKPLFSVKTGTPVTLGLVNRSGFAHAIHVHGHHMRLLHDLDDGWEPYWRDSVLIDAGRTHHVAFLADNPGKWLIECLVLEHGGAGLAGWFEVA